MSIVDFFGGPRDGERREWPDPLPPEILVPAFRLATVLDADEDPSRTLPARVLVYRHRTLGAYDFVEERGKI